MFSFTQLLAFGTFLLVLICSMIGIVIKLMSLGASLKKIKNNELSEFVKRKEFEGLGKEVNKMGKTVERLEERTEKQGKEIETLFGKVNKK